MSYRCQGCDQVCHHTLLKHVVLRTSTDVVRETLVDFRGRTTTRVKTTPKGVIVTRTVTQIDREVPVCVNCLVELEHGVTLAAIQQRFRPRPAQVVQSNCPAGAPPSLEENTAPPARPAAAPMMGGLNNGKASLKRIADLFDDDRR